MLKLSRHGSWFSSLRLRSTAVLGLMVLAAGILAASSAQAQTFTVLYAFTGGADGAEPAQSGLIMDSAGNLYGATAAGGIFHNHTASGVVFKLDASGVETVLTTFSGVNGDGAGPLGTLVRDSSGSLYGTTMSGGYQHSLGTVFKVLPTGGKITTHMFGKGGQLDGWQPIAGLVLDETGNLYGTTTAGGSTGYGVVYRLHIASRKETILHTFTGKRGDGIDGFGPLIRDASGNLYGTAFNGGAYGGACGSFPIGCGIVFEMNPAGNEKVLYKFTGGTDGAYPEAGLVRDVAGNLYGTTTYGGGGACENGSLRGCGTVFKLDKTGKETVLYRFTGGTDGANPFAGLVRDGVGNLYGTTYQGGNTGCQSQMGGCGRCSRWTRLEKKPFCTASPAVPTVKLPSRACSATRRVTYTERPPQAVPRTRTYVPAPAVAWSSRSPHNSRWPERRPSPHLRPFGAGGHQLVDIDEQFVICFGCVLGFILAASSSPHLVHSFRMSPGPVHLFREFIYLSWRELKPGRAIRYDLLHCPHSGTDNRSAARKGLDNCDREIFVELAGKDQEASLSYYFNDLFARDASLEIDSGKIPLPRSFFQSGALRSVPKNHNWKTGLAPFPSTQKIVNALFRGKPSREDGVLLFFAGQARIRMHKIRFHKYSFLGQA